MTCLKGMSETSHDTRSSGRNLKQEPMEKIKVLLIRTAMLSIFLAYLPKLDLCNLLPDCLCPP
jgi:hypothetical protein